ncbi:MAG: Rrf2 family transcriptional regulator [Candidatus Omnitrophica bacterium]|nr:Rrf2 family transcriptional regulator [Candidatus Omnitrophota bacterium]
MKLITRDSDYAIRALCFIAKSKNRIVNVSELTAQLKIPRPFLRKILQTLNKNGLLYSYKGKAGGFELAMRPNKIFVLKIMQIFQGELKLNECFLKKAPCPNVKRCKLKKKVDKIQEYVFRELKVVSLSYLMKKRA